MFGCGRWTALTAGLCVAWGATAENQAVDERRSPQHYAQSQDTAGNPEGNPEQPNIIFVFADDHAFQAVSAYGSVLNETPNIDRLAGEGIRFERVTVTNSICAPSRAVLLTGKHSHLNGQLTNSETFDGEQPTYPQLLQEAGYETAMIGKWHLRSDPTGYDHWDILPGQGNYYNPDFLTPEGRVEHTGYVTDIITDKVIEWLSEERDPDKPFMVNYHHKAPHRNWKPGPDHLTLYDDVEMPEPPTLFDDYSNRASPASNQEMEIDRHMHFYYDLKVTPREDVELTPNGHMNAAITLLEERLTEEQREAWDAAYGPKNDAFYEAYEAGMPHEEVVRWKYQRYVKDYLRTIASIDDNLGRLLDYLDETGLAENTLVVYTSDQGFYLGEHGWYDKRWIYEESFATPFVARWPGEIEPGGVNGALVQNLDFAPTLLEAAGIAPPEGMQGRSFVPMLRGETPEDWRDSVYYHYYESEGPHAVAKHYAVATDRYKLAHFYETGEWELLDREEDPLEINSVYGDPAYAEVQAELKEELLRLREHYGDDTGEPFTVE